MRDGIELLKEYLELQWIVCGLRFCVKVFCDKWLKERTAHAVSLLELEHERRLRAAALEALRNDDKTEAERILSEALEAVTDPV